MSYNDEEKTRRVCNKNDRRPDREITIRIIPYRSTCVYGYITHIKMPEEKSYCTVRRPVGRAIPIAGPVQ